MPTTGEPTPGTAGWRVRVTDTGRGAGTPPEALQVGSSRGLEQQAFHKDLIRQIGTLKERLALNQS